MGTDDRDRETVDERRRPRPKAEPARIGGDRYRLGDAIGRGGMGEVVTAQDEQLGREVAIKRIAGEATERRIERFVREARIQGRLQHPAIPPVHELGRDADGLPYFAMKKLAGTTLAVILDTRQPGEQRPRLLRAFTDVCLAVEFAHVHGVLHRDIKPQNIMLGEFGEVYLLDWGVAKILGEADTFDDMRGSDGQTVAGTAIGTPGYMAPEQARGDTDVDARADVYALGRVLAEIIDGDPDVPPEIDALVHAACAEDRSQRIATARQLADAVEQYLDGDRDLARRRQLAGQHQARAEAAFASDDSPANRRTAMLEAGRALALDPTSTAAAQLVSRLVLEPPRVPPPEVLAAMRADAKKRTRSTGFAAFLGAFGYLIILPAVIAIGQWTYTVMAAALIAATFAVALAYMRGRALPLPIAFGAHAGMLVLIGRMYSPMWAAPSVGIVIAMAFGVHPMMKGVRSSLLLWIAIMAACLGEVAAEAAGWIGATATTTDAGALTVHGVSMLASSWSPIALGLLWITAGITVAVVFTHVHRVAEHRIRLAFHLQAWQVRQLVA